MIDHEKYKKKDIVLRKTSEGTDTMSYYEMARWMSLIEGVEFVSKKCEQLNIPDKSNCWIKPNALQKYVEERHTSMLFEISEDDTIC